MADSAGSANASVTTPRTAGSEELYGSNIRKGDSYDPEAFTYYPVAIIGAGESGIAMGCRLKEKLGFDQFRIFDRQSGIGGTWWINRYPGVACDVPAVFYSFSFAQNPNWTSLYPTGREIVSYLQGVAENYGIVDKIQVNTNVKSCSWNETEGVWDLVLQHMTVGAGDLSAHDRKQRAEDEGESTIYTRIERIKAKVVISCVGGLVEPNQWPSDISGREKFQGEIFHSARWKYDVDLTDKDVIVLGTGCSAAQFVPRLRREYGAKTVTQIMRSPPWVVPKQVNPVGQDTTVWLNTYVPGYQNAFRKMVAVLAEWEWRWFYDTKYAAKERAKVEEQMLKHMKKQVPEKYHEILTPDYSIGCKRRIFDAEWLRSLREDHIELTTLPLKSLNEKSVVLGPGRTYPPMSDTASKAPSHQVTIPADVIILANGFVTTAWLHPLEINGRGDKKLHDIYEERGGPQMYMGAAMDEFPNFFTIFGPNTATGHSSVVLASENMVEMTLKLIKPVLSGDASEVEIKKQAEIDFTADIQKALKKTVWHMGGCQSWYFNKKDDWNSTVYPYSQIWFMFRCLFPTWSDWNITYTAQGVRKRRRAAVIRYLTYAAVIISLIKARQAGHTVSDLPVLVRQRLRTAIDTGKAVLIGAIAKV